MSTPSKFNMNRVKTNVLINGLRVSHRFTPQVRDNIYLNKQHAELLKSLKNKTYFFISNFS